MLEELLIQSYLKEGKYIGKVKEVIEYQKSDDAIEYNIKLIDGQVVEGDTELLKFNTDKEWLEIFGMDCSEKLEINNVYQINFIAYPSHLGDLPTIKLKITDFQKVN